WKELRESVYCNFTNNARFLWQQRPAYHRCETMNINGHYFQGIESFMSVSDKYDDNPLYVSDAIQYAALYLAAKADDVLNAANLALAAGDVGKVGQLQKQLSQMLLEMDRLLESHPVYRLQRWFDMADASATDEMESAAFKREIRRLLTVWSGPTLKDYSARVWSGLIRDFYVPRLNFYFDKAIRGEYADMVEYDMLFLDVAEPGELSAVQPFADPLKEACRLVDRYSDIVGGNDCSAGEGVLYW
ncbi:MAG: alpha-N-acetylglucosaminidase C-terminal domain-containing protein, partial [Bacteroidales bacterium]|nr:alpha-N-acetylglucosaminidase C-terminal domain-containing protein [Bacteroidales bacterium]